MLSLNPFGLLTVAAVLRSLTSAQFTGTYPAIAPVLAENFPDPALVVDADAYYAFSTSGNGLNIQVAVSADFVNHEWRLLGKDINVLPDPGPWSVNDQKVWAPDDNGLWVMYYAGTAASDPSKHCVGVATSNGLLGPYNAAEEPFACPLEVGGAIDPDAFLDPKSGNLYVVYKVDGNSLNVNGAACGDRPSDGVYHPTPIMLQQVSKDDGITKLGDPVRLLDRADADGPLIEAPSMMYNQETDLYFLTFSSNCYSTDLYDVGFAYSTCLADSFTKSKYTLMTSTSTGLISPGGADMTIDGQYALYHATVNRDEHNEPIRHLYAANTTQAGINMVAIPVF